MGIAFLGRVALGIALISPTAFAFSVNDAVLNAISAMPKGGGYSLTDLSAQKLMDAFSWQTDNFVGPSLHLNSKQATPSYCTTATYQIFYKALQDYWKAEGIHPSQEILALFKPEMEKDGVRIWGRWNANGPGTAKFAFDSGMGMNFGDLGSAVPGDFLKIYWSDAIGMKESGHSVIYLGHRTENGVPVLRVWSSNSKLGGYSLRSVPRSLVKHMVFTRFKDFKSYTKVTELPEVDDFLQSMLTRASSWDELRKVSGF